MGLAANNAHLKMQRRMGQDYIFDKTSNTTFFRLP